MLQPVKNTLGIRVRQAFYKRWQLYVLLFFPVLYILIFSYAPMFGILIAFKEFSIRGGLLAGKWVGLKYFEQFITTPTFSRLLYNTVTLSLYSLVAGFPFPILLALALNEIRQLHFKKTVQTVTYAPYFISTVVMVGIIMQVLHYRFGLLNNIIVLLGGERFDFMGRASLFRHIYVWSGVWQGSGFSAIVYVAALSSVDPELVEAATIDGAGRLSRIWNIDLPAIAPTVVVLFILAVGGIMSVGFDKAFLMQNSINLSDSEIISTYVYKRGLEKMQFSYATAVGLFNSVVNFVLLFITNTLSKKLTESSLW